MKPSLIIISGSAGSGKDCILKGIKEKLPDLCWTKTTTNRKPRRGESESNPYYFVSDRKFKEMIKQKAFLEYENVYQDKYFGMTKKEINSALKRKNLIIWQIDFRGFRKIKKIYLKKIISIFILPPSPAIAQKRIKKRGEWDKTFIEERMKLAKEEKKASQEYDYRIINQENKLSETIAKIIRLIEKNCGKRR